MFKSETLISVGERRPSKAIYLHALPTRDREAAVRHRPARGHLSGGPFPFPSSFLPNCHAVPGFLVVFMQTEGTFLSRALSGSKILCFIIPPAPDTSKSWT